MTEHLVIYEQGNTSWGAYSPDRPGVAVVGDTREGQHFGVDRPVRTPS